MKLISEFYSDNQQRKASVFANGDTHVVKLYENGVEIDTKDLGGKNLYFAEDTAENFVMYWGSFKTHN